MELENKTRYSARLFRTVIDEERIAAAVIARITYDLEDGALQDAVEQPWIVSAPPWIGPEGPMESDDIFYRDGIDIFLFGHATSPNLQPVTSTSVALHCNGFRRQLQVFGDRHWVVQGDKISATAPKPFTRIPLTMQYAFGGADDYDGLSVPYPDNPAGRGFCLSADTAAGKLLPNIEEPEHLILSWKDQPVPAGCGFCPVHFGPRMARGFELSADGSPKSLTSRMFNAAFPNMIAAPSDFSPGADFMVEGVRADGILHFRIPPCDLKVHLQIGDTDWQRPLEIDQLGVQADKGQVFITYRFPFRYSVVPHQQRTCTLLVDNQGA